VDAAQACLAALHVDALHGHCTTCIHSFVHSFIHSSIHPSIHSVSRSVTRMVSHSVIEHVSCPRVRYLQPCIAACMWSCFGSQLQPKQTTVWVDMLYMRLSAVPCICPARQQVEIKFFIQLCYTHASMQSFTKCCKLLPVHVLLFTGLGFRVSACLQIDVTQLALHVNALQPYYVGCRESRLLLITNYI